MQAQEMFFAAFATAVLVAGISLVVRACDSEDYHRCLAASSEVSACKELQP